MTRRNHAFQTVRSAGALLPPDILQRIASLELDGLSPKDYHLPSGVKINEAIAQSWVRMLARWKDFRKAQNQIPESDVTGGVSTRENWLLPLIQELGYGRLTRSKAPEIEGRLYPIERFWDHLPLHLIGCKLSLDRRAKGVRGAATASPHSLVQEFLNRSDDHLWAVLSNGLQLRLLRDNFALSRLSFVEFDLESMMDGEIYSDFALLWLVCHQSRVEADKPEETWLEKWSALVKEHGTRVLEDLRSGVTRAIECLGQGFLAHPRNEELRRKLREGTLSTEDYYRQLLRIIYRLLFLFVAEDRDLLLLPLPQATPEQRGLYDRFYSMDRLRRLAESIRGSKHSDLWYGLSQLFAWLYGPENCPELALPALGSFLFNPDSTAGLDGVAEGSSKVRLSNESLLAVTRALAFVERDRVLRRVDYRNLGSEELGSVYESLLELHPVLNAEAATFSLNITAGSERKTSGSYYTPDSLVQSLLDSALEPVVSDRKGGKTEGAAEEALLSITVCDPAAGSGHFLIAAAHRLARHLARIRTGDNEPAPEDYQHALRDVIRSCVYGVDINPMAAELCKVALWMESIEPGKPLTFLDHHIQVGNSLLGATPELLRKGIPDSAFKPIEGDEKKAASALRKRNTAERKGLGPLFAQQDAETQALLEQAATEMEMLPDDLPVDVIAKERAFHNRSQSGEYRRKKALADAWCAAFVIEKQLEEPGRDQSAVGITQGSLNDLADEKSLPADLTNEVRLLSREYQFVHWHLEFPEIFANGGFDCVLSNPPWERVKLQEKEWFAKRNPAISNARTTAARKRMIEALEESSPSLLRRFKMAQRHTEAISHLLRDSGRYPLCGRGDINTYAVFAEAMRGLLRKNGRAGSVLPTGIATDDTTKYFFQEVVESDSLASLFSFENEELIFPEVHHATRFCLFTMGSGAVPISGTADFVFFARQVHQLEDPDRRFTLSADDINLLNPNTRTCPIFRSRRDAELTKALYRRIPVLIREARDGDHERNPWGIKYKRMFDMSNDSHLFRTQEQLESDGWRLDGNSFRRKDEEYLPLYEAKMLHHFDHRWGTYEGQTKAQANQGKLPELSDTMHADPSLLALPRYWVEGSQVREQMGGWTSPWLLGFRNITGATVLRTIIASPMPMVAVGHSMPLMLPSATPAQCAGLAALLASFVADYTMRQKLGGTNLTYGYLNQLPSLTPLDMGQPCRWADQTVSLEAWYLPRVLELCYSAWDLRDFAEDCGWSGPPFLWDRDRRFHMKCELHAAFFHLYLPSQNNGGWNPVEGETRDELDLLQASFPTPRDAVDYIMDTFPIVLRRDEEQYGHYRTKDTILDIYDRMQQAIRTGVPYRTLLDPPPADPSVAHPPQKAETGERTH